MSRGHCFSWFSPRSTSRRRSAMHERCARSNARRLRIEPLEDRLLLATFLVSNLNDAGAGSLRQAISDANSLTGVDVIEFSSVSGTIALTSGQMEITEALTIDGPGQDVLTIDAQLQSRATAS